MTARFGSFGSFFITCSKDDPPLPIYDGATTVNCGDGHRAGTPSGVGNALVQGPKESHGHGSGLEADLGLGHRLRFLFPAERLRMLRLEFVDDASDHASDYILLIKLFNAWCAVPSCKRTRC